MTGKEKRKGRLREKVEARFEDSLDICNFVSVYSSLSLMLSLLFTPEQLLLFQYQKAHYVKEKKRDFLSLSKNTKTKDPICKVIYDKHGLLRLGAISEPADGKDKI